MNLNPRSLYNKVDDLKLVLEQYEADCVCISESWERENFTLQELIGLDNYTAITNVHQRDFGGGKPAILVRNDKYHIKPLSPEVITVPIGVEAVWALIMPKHRNPRNKIKYIAVCSLYYRGPKCTKRKELYDHVADSYNTLLAKYGPNLHFCIAGDTNKLNLTPILNLSPSLEQVVKVPTRLNPDAILDKIITTMKKYYCSPVTKPPLLNDENNGKPSDHLIVLMLPISSILECTPRRYETVQYRPITDSGILKYESWLTNQTWAGVYAEQDCHKKAELFQKELYQNFEKCFPLKTFKTCPDDRPWFTKALKSLDRKRKREFSKNKKSEKWVQLNHDFVTKLNFEKKNYYEKIVADLKGSNTSQWYSKVKRMSGQEKFTDKYDTVDELIGKKDEDQREIIADHYAKISHEFEPVETSHFENYLTSNKHEMPPNVGPYKVLKTIKKMNKRASSVPGDIPMKIIQKFADELTLPLCHIINSCLKAGVYPKIWKSETVTPVPKVHPPEKLDQLRKISGLMNFSKVFDKILAEFLVKDMEPNIDKAQYGNVEGLSTQHYLVKMLHQVLLNLDSSKPSESSAVLMSMIDWSQAFDRQSHILGIQSFIDNGVRPSLIPILISFFQERCMRVKWNGGLSSERSLPGGGPQGGIMGTLEYNTQTNGNTNYISTENKYKYIDDLSTLEIIKLLMLGLTSYNVKAHVPSDVSIDSKYAQASSLKTQNYLDKLSDWTEKNQMKLNTNKTEYMIFNFSKENQFNTRLQIKDQVIRQVNQSKLLGVILSDNLKWHANTKYIIDRCYKRMIILRNLYPFDIPLAELVSIYCLYIRSVAEYSSVVWSSSITEGECLELERIQKVALRIILKEDYVTYSHALSVTNLQTLKERRRMLLTRFAVKCVKNPKTSEMFPRKTNFKNLRNPESFQVTRAKTDRLAFSAIPTMQRLLNLEARKKHI